MSRQFDDFAQEGTVPPRYAGRDFSTLSINDLNIIREYRGYEGLCQDCGVQLNVHSDETCQGIEERINASMRKFVVARSGEAPPHLCGRLYSSFVPTERREVYWHRVKYNQCVYCGSLEHKVEQCGQDEPIKSIVPRVDDCPRLLRGDQAFDSILVSIKGATGSTNPHNVHVDTKGIVLPVAQSHAGAHPPSVSNTCYLQRLPAEVRATIFELATQLAEDTVLVRAGMLPAPLLTLGLPLGEVREAYFRTHIFIVSGTKTATLFLRALTNLDAAQHVRALTFTNYGMQMVVPDSASKDVRDPDFMLILKCTNLNKLRITMHSHKFYKSRDTLSSDQFNSVRVIDMAQAACFKDFVHAAKLKELVFRGVKGVDGGRPLDSRLEDDLAILARWMKRQFVAHQMEVCLIINQCDQQER